MNTTRTQNITRTSVPLESAVVGHCLVLRDTGAAGSEDLPAIVEEGQEDRLATRRHERRVARDLRRHVGAGGRGGREPRRSAGPRRSRRRPPRPPSRGSEGPASRTPPLDPRRRDRRTARQSMRPTPPPVSRNRRARRPGQADHARTHASPAAYGCVSRGRLAGRRLFLGLELGECRPSRICPRNGSPHRERRSPPWPGGRRRVGRHRREDAAVWEQSRFMSHAADVPSRRPGSRATGSAPTDAPRHQSRSRR